MDARARRHSRALDLRAGGAPGGAARRARRPARLRGAGAVSGCAGDPRARGRWSRPSTRPERKALVEQLVALPLTEDGRYAGAIARWLRARSGRRGPARRNHRAGGAGGDVGTAVGRRADCAAGDLGRAALSPRSRRRRTPPPSARPRKTGRRGARRPRSISRPRRARWPPTRSPSPTSKRSSTKLTAAADDLPRRIGRDNEETAPPGVAPAPNRARGAAQVTEELSKDVRNKDVKRVARAAEPLIELSDSVLADVLLSIAYAADVGDPDGTVLLADDVSRRHDFGFNAREADAAAAPGMGGAARRGDAGRALARQRIAARPRHRPRAAGAAPPQFRARARGAEAHLERARHVRDSASRC